MTLIRAETKCERLSFNYRHALRTCKGASPISLQRRGLLHLLEGTNSHGHRAQARDKYQRTMENAVSRQWLTCSCVCPALPYRPDNLRVPAFSQPPISLSTRTSSHPAEKLPLYYRRSIREVLVGSQLFGPAALG